MFDRTFLPSAELEFVVVSDSHFILDPEPYAVEFASVREWSRRAGWALKVAKALEGEFVVHLGDLAEENPAKEDYLEVRIRALAQVEQEGLDPYWVAGNMDIGDKPDGTMFSDWVSRETLDVWEQHFSRSWYSFDRGDCHLVVLNSQIINGSLPQAAAQQSWLQRDLAAHQAQRIILLLHMPPFFVDEDEPDRGFYNSLDEPGRSWLTGLIRRHRVELLLAGHTHFRAFNRIGDARFLVAPSTTTSRAGFGEAFTVGPAPEQGRNDTAKLGLLHVRVQESGTRVHFVRTSGELEMPTELAGWQRVLTRTSLDLPASPIGVLTRNPLAHQSAGAVAWPSLLRQRVRDDHPFLSCLELGVRHVRVPASDLADQLQCQRLALLRDEGVQVTAFWLSNERMSLSDQIEPYADAFDSIELQAPGMLWPSAACGEELADCARRFAKPATFTPVLTREVAGGTYHPRTRLGYRVSELPELDRLLTAMGVAFDRVMVHIDAAAGERRATGAEAGAWQTATALTAMLPLTSVAGFDLAPPPVNTDEHAQTRAVAEAVFASALLPGCRLFLDPLVDLDRTNDTALGLLDRLANPRRAFHAARTLNTILFSSPEAVAAGQAPSGNRDRVLALVGAARRFFLILPDGDTVDGSTAAALDVREPVSLFWLERGLSQHRLSGLAEVRHSLDGLSGPCLLIEG
jgi:predicted phosphodiesterase